MDNQFKEALEKGEIKYGKIANILGALMSGLWQIAFEDGSVCYIESGYGMRSLASAFDVQEGVDGIKVFIGKEIYYSVDACGVLEGFTPKDMI